MNKIETFDDAIIFNNIDKGKLGIYQSFSQWAALLRDVAVSLYEWHGNISFQDLLLIEEYIFNRQEFALVRCKYKVGKAIVLSDNYHIFQVTTFGEIRQGEPKAIRIVGENLPKNLVRHYTIDNFVYFYISLGIDTKVCGDAHKVRCFVYAKCAKVITSSYGDQQQVNA